MQQLTETIRQASIGGTTNSYKWITSLEKKVPTKAIMQRMRGKRNRKETIKTEINLCWEILLNFYLLLEIQNTVMQPND